MSHLTSLVANFSMLLEFVNFTLNAHKTYSCSRIRKSPNVFNFDE